MSSILRITVVLMLATGAGAAAQDNPLIGSWKLNPAESDAKGRSLAVKQITPDEIEIRTEGQSYRATLDGKPRPALYGYTEAWTKAGDNEWQSVTTLDGRPISTDTYRLSPDGRTLTLTSRGEKANGGRFEDQVTFTRAEATPSVATGTAGGSRGSGAGSLEGTWKGEDYTTTSPGTIELAPNGPDGIHFSIPKWGSKASVKFDGKDYPFTSPMLPAGFTMSMTRTGDRTFEITYKQDGKPTGTSTWTISPDGKRMTILEQVPGQRGASKSVLERQ